VETTGLRGFLWTRLLDLDDDEDLTGDTWHNCGTVKSGSVRETERNTQSRPKTATKQ